MHWYRIHPGVGQATPALRDLYSMSNNHLQQAKTITSSLLVQHRVSTIHLNIHAAIFPSNFFLPMHLLHRALALTLTLTLTHAPHLTHDSTLDRIPVSMEI